MRGFYGAVCVALLACLAGALAEEKVLTLTTATFDQALTDHPFMLVEFYAPWCGHCKSLAPEYEKAAQALEGDMDAGVAITLAKVDATEEKALGERFGVSGYPTLKIFTKGSDKPADYDGPRDANGIVSHLKKRAGPASMLLDNADKAASLKEKEKVLLLFVGKNTDEWMSLADSMRDAAAWAHTTNKDVMSKLGVKGDGVYVLKDFDEGTVKYDGKATDADGIKAFINMHRAQVAMPIRKGDQAALKIVFEDEKVPNAFLFTAAAAEEEIAAFKEGCMPTRGQFVTGNFLSSDFPEAFAHFGMDKFIADGSLPRVLIEDRKEGLRYLMDGAITKDNVSKFLADYMAGSLEPFLKSEEVPADNGEPVKVIVGSTFQDEVNNSGKWTLLEAYAPWCGHCKKLTPVWEDVANGFADDATVVIAKVDATANDLPKSLGINGFPTLQLFKGDGSPPENYIGDRDFASISKWLTTKTGAKVKEGFKPTSGEATKPSEPLDKQILKFLAADFQVPWMGAGMRVSGLYLAAIALFLVFVASIAIVIAILTRDPAPTAGKSAESKKEK
mmetsp:Transcript_50537/g.123243  ORF Transcript_50537/g.123243 Transcript_50537/m.123243 type:complete len:560 (-) Transcript_50537:140-1819(-)|eukprot:CAMPEP_0206232704 /NCGR_PEP_ID=MMETSP0047_2-20121206/11563_1 /ASSEMBLY_ACC=CAM_ASM_000192 /TAXON_ID=195065 /ORGANISM="Chroomonas mesostigmatica_cf, Strain CCMP1168" /LENGTH=559 /DNA_ID=CAMNT_0053656469 /DNA_START=137 /DNA_END=1816 /DNA_ORIENTATION=+